jgi:chorismate mutase
MSYYLPPLINGKAYEWADILLNIGGQPMTGITSIEYAENQTMENVYAAGRFPNARTYGRVEPTAKISLLMSTVEALQASAPLGRIQDIPEFDIPVLYLDTNNVTVKHKLRNCRFTMNQRTSSAEGGAIIVEIDLVISHIEWV